MTTTRTEYDRIVGFNFTLALMGGAWIRRESGALAWETFAAIEKEIGWLMLDYLINKQGTFTGCEIKVTDEDRETVARDEAETAAGC